MQLPIKEAQAHFAFHTRRQIVLKAFLKSTFTLKGITLDNRQDDFGLREQRHLSIQHPFGAVKSVLNKHREA